MNTNNVALSEWYRCIRCASQKQTVFILQLYLGTHQLDCTQIEVHINDHRLHLLRSIDGLTQITKTLDDKALTLQENRIGMS